MSVKPYLDWAARRPSMRRVVITLALAGGLLLAGLPLLIGGLSNWLDRLLGLPRLPGGLGLGVAGVVLMGAGGLFALWAVVAEARIGSGTPVPMIPTQRLVVAPPYTYCRNPMVLGTATGYLGFAVWLGSASAIALVLVFAALLLGYVKVLEEPELAARFGDDYLEYRRRTPFLVPRLRRRQEVRV